MSKTTAEIQSELPGRNEPVVHSRRGDTSAEPLPGESSVSRLRPAATSDPMTDLSVSQAADMLAKRRQPPPATQPTADEQPLVSESEQPPVDSEELELDGGENLEPDVNEDPLDSEEEQPDEEIGESEQPQTMVVAGQELTAEEINEGFMRQDDYTRKTQHVAEREQQVDQREEYFASRLGQIDGILRSEVAQFEQINWPQLAQQDMHKYTVLQAQATEAQRRYDTHQAEIEKFFNQVETRKKADYDKKIADATAELRTAFKGQWSNAKYYDLVDFMSSNFGVDREDILSRVDPLLFRLAAEAQSFRNAKRVKTVPKVQRTGKRVPSSSRGTTPEGRQTTQRSGSQRKADTSMAALQKSGTLDAAADAFAAKRQLRARQSRR